MPPFGAGKGGAGKLPQRGGGDGSCALGGDGCVAALLACRSCDCLVDI